MGWRVDVHVCGSVETGARERHQAATWLVWTATDVLAPTLPCVQTLCENSHSFRDTRPEGPAS